MVTVSSEPLMKLNLNMLGDDTVGKTTLVRKMDNKQYSKSHIRTTGLDSIRFEYTAKDGVKLNCRLVDTAGQERFRTLTYSYYRNADAVILAFNLTSRESFNSCTTWLQSLKKHGAEQLPKMLVGNKVDLLEESNDCVNDIEAQKLANENNMIYMKTCALTGLNVEEMFHNAIEQAYEYKKESLKL